MTTDLEILDNVEICIINNIDDTKTYYKTTIIDKYDNNIFYTGYINNLNGTMLSSNNNSISYKLYSKTNKGIFCWEILYLGNKKLDTIYTSEFQVISNPSKVQKREFYRHPLYLPIRFYINDANYLNKTNEDSLTGTMINISGGGCAFVSQYKMELNSLINIDFKYKNSVYNLVGRTLNINKLPGPTVYEYRMQWENNNIKIIDDIIKLLFTIQRDNTSS